MSAQQPHLVEVREAHRFDEDKLARYLHEVLASEFADGFEIQQFEGGQSNPTFLLKTPGGQRYVLRKKPPGKLLPSAHQVEREYRVIAALNPTDVPVPEALHLCEDDSVIGTPFYVMRFVEGRVFDRPSLDGAADGERGAMFSAMAETLARLHRVDYEAAGLGDFGKPGNYISRQIDRWSRQYEASRADNDAPSMDKLMAWLPENLPAGDETTIAHGDFRPGNLMFHPERSEVVSILDWELCTLGHPLSDLAYFCIPWHLPTGLPGMSGLDGLDLKALGIPSEQEFVREYCQRAGRGDGIEDWPFYVAFALFRLAAILQGVYKRGLDGNASSASATQMGQGVEFLAAIGWQQTRALRG